MEAQTHVRAIDSPMRETRECVGRERRGETKLPLLLLLSANHGAEMNSGSKEREV